MAERVFQYLKGRRNYKLIFDRTDNGLTTYSDASLGDCKNSLTTCRYLIRLFRNSVAWRTHKQQSVALFTCQAEYVAMSEACQGAMSLHNSISIMLEQKSYPLTLYCNNMSAISCAKINGGNLLRH